MKQHFQMLNDPRFHLVYGVNKRFHEGAIPSFVRLSSEGFTLVQGLKKKSVVYPGMLLAEHPTLEKGDLFASIHGEVTEVNERSIFLKAIEPPADAPTVPKVDLIAQDLKGEDLVLAIKKMGVNTRSLGQRCKTLIINGLNPEPGISWAEPILTKHVNTLRMGIQLIRRLERAEKFILAVPTGLNLTLDGVQVVHVNADYPNSINELVIKSVTGKENPPDVACVGLHNVWSIGRVGVTGLPLTETVITLASYQKEYWENYIIKDGSTIGDILDIAQITLKEGDTVVRGGPLRGESIDALNRSVTKGTQGIFVIEKGSVPPMEGHSPCINCGACVLACPARLAPSNLSRYAEFALHDRCRNEYIFSCLDCGLCGYVCMARRPVLQYIRLAKHKLLEEEHAALVELQLHTSA